MRVFILSEDHTEIIMRGVNLATILYDIKTKKAAYAVITCRDEQDFRVFPIDRVFLMSKTVLSTRDDKNLGDY